MFNNVKIHNIKRDWYKYIIPKRLTLKCNPPIFKWLIFVFRWKKRDKGGI